MLALVLCVAGAAAGELAPPADPAASPAPARRRMRLSYPGAAGLAAAAFGNVMTPSMTAPYPGNVATAEAWRRKLKSRERIPLLARSPPILAAGILGYSLAEYARAFSTHGPTGSLEHVMAWRVGCVAYSKACVTARKAAEECKKSKVQIDEKVLEIKLRAKSKAKK